MNTHTQNPLFSVADLDFGPLFAISEPQVMAESEPEFEDDDSYVVTITYAAATDPSDANAAVYLVVAKAFSPLRGHPVTHVDVVSTTRVADDRARTRFFIEAVTCIEDRNIWPAVTRNGELV